jgi:hypothetical protein
MATYTLRPNADWDYASSFNGYGGAASIHAALADNSDTTYIKRVSLTVPATYYMEMDTQSLASTERITSVNLRARLSIGASGYVQFSLGVITDRNGRTVNYSVPISKQNTLALSTIDLALNLPAAPNGAEWTQTLLDNLVVKFTDGAESDTARAQLYEVYVDVVTTSQPTVSVDAPGGTVTDTSFPSITWTYSDGDGDAQAAYEIKIFDSATYSGGTFSPSTSVGTVETGIIASANNGQTLEVDLANNTTYRAYVRVAQLAGASYFWSEWDYSQFSLSIDAPAEPTLSAYYDSTKGAVTVTIYGRTNMLTPNQASLETNTTGWTASSNCAIARSTSQYSAGTASLSMTASASGDMTAATNGTAFPVTPGSAFSARAEFKAGTTARSVSVGIRWLTSAGATISTTYGTAATDSSSAWTTASYYATAPATAAGAQVFVKVASAGSSEVHYVDKIAFHAGNSPTYTSGGFSGFAFDVERSSDSGATYTTIRNSPVSADASQIATIDDYESPLQTTVRYRAKARATV